MFDAIFISDLHLSINNPSKVTMFFKWLDTYKYQTKAIYILGDFFEFYLDDDLDDDFYVDIAKHLKQASTDTKIFLMHGNRDFLIGEVFCSSANVQLLKNDVELIDVNNSNILIAHGDTFYTEDKKYLFFRKIIRSRLLLIIFNCISKNAKLNIASKLRETSKQNNQLKSLHINFELMKKLLIENNAQTFIFGHIHKEQIISFDGNSFISLNEWLESTNFLTVKNNKFEFNNVRL